MQRLFNSIYWHPTLFRVLIAIVCLAAAVWLVLEYFNPAPPSTITIATGFKGGASEFYGQQYRERLARAHVTLIVRTTDGSTENIKLLENPASGVQVGFVLAGASNDKQAPGLLSLGRVYYQVFWIFYRGTETLDHLTQLRGKRIGVGPEAVIAMRILDAAGVSPDSATILPLAGEAAVAALEDGRVDAVFIALAPEASGILQPLFRDPAIRLMNISQTEALTRIFPYLVRLVLPQGVIDLERNVPPDDANLIGTTNSVVVRKDLHPDIIDLLAQTLVEVHSAPGIFQRAGEFPTQTDPQFPVADGAREFYRNGPSYFSRYLSFWMVSRVKKIIAVLLSCAVLLVPVSNFFPRLTKWLVRDRMRYLYGRLRAIETNMQSDLTASQLDALQSDLEEIDQSANNLGVPARYSDMFFEFKTHINLVRQRLGSRRAALPREMGHAG